MLNKLICKIFGHNEDRRKRNEDKTEVVFICGRCGNRRTTKGDFRFAG